MTRLKEMLNAMVYSSAVRSDSGLFKLKINFHFGKQFSSFLKGETYIA